MLWYLAVLRSALLRRIDVSLLKDACSLLFVMLFLLVVWCFFPCLLKEGKRHHVKGYLFWNTDSVRMVSVLNLAMRDLLGTEAIAVTNSQQVTAVSKDSCWSIQVADVTGTMSSAWIIWMSLVPDGLESAILKTKYPSYLLPIHLISTESELPQDEEGIPFYLLTVESSRLDQDFYQCILKDVSLVCCYFFRFFQVCVKSGFLSCRKLSVIFECPENKIWFIVCSSNSQMPNR